MFQIITIVLPVFGLIILGWASVRTGYVSQFAGKGLSEYAFKIAMPAFLFNAVRAIGEWPSSPLNLIYAYCAAAAIVWVLATLMTALVLRRPAADAPSLAMASTFSNSVMLGIPLAISAFGEAAAAPAALLVTIDSPLLWIAATLHISAVARDRDTAPLRALAGIVLDLLRNPIVMALALGVIARAVDLQLPELVEKTIALTAQSAVPAALFALGMSLATYKLAGQGPTLTMLCLLKLAAFPAIAYAMCVHVFDVQPLWTAVATLFAAMPVGANAYLFAARYERAVGSVSTAIMVSTAIAIFTASGLLYWLTAHV